MSNSIEKRKIPASGINLFQLIYKLIDEYTQRTNLKPLNLSLGNPDTVPQKQVLEICGKTVSNQAFEYHTYAEDNNIDLFAEGMIRLHGQIEVNKYPFLRSVPIPGIKSATTILPLACGLHKKSDNFCLISNLPAYDIIGTWSTDYLRAKRVVWPLMSENNMRLDVDSLTELIGKDDLNPDLIFVIRPGNPAAVGCTVEEWRKLIKVCIDKNVRLANDAAYSGLSGKNHVPLASVAKDYPELEWVELYSVSKSFSDPGARLGALVGSQAFVEDFIMIKGNTDSGPVPGVMGAYGKLFQDEVLAKSLLENTYKMYQSRLEYLIPTLKKAGLQPACETEAGFFTLWKTPKVAFGINIEKYAKENNYALHEAFNRLTILESGIVGVHFSGPQINGKQDPLIRYAVCTDTADPEFQKRFENELQRMAPEY